MSKLRKKLLGRIFRMTNLKNASAEDLLSKRIRGYLQLPSPPWFLFWKHRVERFRMEGRNVYRIRPWFGGGDKTVLYLHGGVYIYNSAIAHWALVDKLVNRLGCTVVYPDYPLAPEHGYKDVFGLLDPLYRSLLETERPEDLVLMGDSSGGGIALSLAQKMLLEGVPQPGRIVLFSPSLDVSLSNEGIEDVEPRDPILSPKALRELSARLITEEADRSSYLVSPIHGPIAGLAPIILFVGTREILLPDARKLKALCEEQGVPVDYFEYENMVHTFVLFGLPESKDAIRQLVRLLRR